MNGKVWGQLGFVSWLVHGGVIASRIGRPTALPKNEKKTIKYREYRFAVESVLCSWRCCYLWCDPWCNYKLCLTNRSSLEYPISQTPTFKAGCVCERFIYLIGYCNCGHFGNSLVVKHSLESNMGRNIERAVPIAPSQILLQTILLVFLGKKRKEKKSAAIILHQTHPISNLISIKFSALP